MKPTDDVRPHDAVTLIVVTWLCLRAYWWVSAKAGRLMDIVSLEALLKLALWLPICAVVVWLMHRRTRRFTLNDLGLGPGLLRGFLFGLATTAPMLVAVAMLPKSPLDSDMLLGSALIGPVAEELLFRGFLFQQLMRRAGWSVPLAIAVSSMLFGLAHVRVVDMDLSMAMSGPGPLAFYVFRPSGDAFRVMTNYDLWWQHITGPLPNHLLSGLPYAAGGALFAWVAYRWKSLWPAIAVHGFVNLWWGLAQGEQARLGYRLDALSVAQALSIALAIGLTIRVTTTRSSQGFPN